jgi:hypothetical protein
MRLEHHMKRRDFLNYVSGAAAMVPAPATSPNAPKTRMSATSP